MSKKECFLIAKVLRKYAGEYLLIDIVNDLCKALKTNNNNFNEDKFKEYINNIED